jgi:hypothetical protein
MRAVERDELRSRLDDLIVGHNLEGGAELVVDEPDGREALRAPLARMWRFDDDGTAVWVRPVVGGYHRDGIGDVFSLSLARSRALSLSQVTVDGRELRLELATGQRARIRPISAELAPELERWDTFVVCVLPADVEADLDRLADDSWHGEWA